MHRFSEHNSADLRLRKVVGNAHGPPLECPFDAICDGRRGAGEESSSRLSVLVTSRSGSERLQLRVGGFAADPKWGEVDPGGSSQDEVGDHLGGSGGELDSRTLVPGGDEGV